MNIQNISKEIKKYISDNQWLLFEEGYTGDENLELESKFCLASGLMSLRASHFEGTVRKTLPANYMHGVFDKDRAFQRELVNLPNWNILKIFYKTIPMGLEVAKEIENYTRILDMKKGMVYKSYIETSFDGRKTKIESIHFLSRELQDTGIFRVYVTPLNYSGQIEFENTIDASITNFIDFPRFRVKHYNVKNISMNEENILYVNSETKDFKLPITTASKIYIYTENGEEIEKIHQDKSYGEYGVDFFDLNIEEGKTYIIEKRTVIKNGLNIDNPEKEALEKIKKLESETFDELVDAHVEEYEKLWNRADIVIKGDEKVQKAIRFNIFHLMSTPNPKSNDTNIGAKLMHGEEYGGHAFWDTELFILPYFINVFPEVAKNLVEYRYKKIEGAYKNAMKFGYTGARYPWESADTGEEECPDWTIEPDGTCYKCTVAQEEIHVTADIVYGGYNYYKMTNDKDYFKKFLLILYETSRYWLSRLEYSKEKDIYELTGVTGPDEWHENVRNNFYTNYIVKWVLELANRIFTNQSNDDLVKEFILNKNVEDKMIRDFHEVSSKIKIKNTKGLIEQFEGYFDLIDYEIYEWDKNNMPILPKEIKGIKRDLTTINKQADVVMAHFIFFDKFDLETKQINYDYYEKRTLHRSSLSPSIFSLMGLKLGFTENAEDYFKRSLFVDFDNNQGNTREGIHAASCGGTWQALVYGFAGLEFKEGKLHFTPRLPKSWELLEFSLVFKNKLNKIKINNEKVDIYEEELC
ncbi:glycoside hydrolase family 65 protein [Streptobacillus felis]|uniref:Glycoside hydrolase family 65 protein n=1 Tax=Streptobacillus felis TaxID=1384509 RepID=A0A7Z0PEM0_9FUSO|nr:glycoside hydrolase family 65 protein [Streptobacillus felis]NYV27853.1 glycoside hydrolase family 65 protein [Streptobacillus felis]